jgi:SAM-dependent methyltransferase
MTSVTATIDHVGEKGLVEALEPIRQTYRAFAIEALFACGLFERLVDEGLPTSRAAAELGLEETRCRALAYYLANEGLLSIRDDVLRLSDDARRLAPYRPWYELMIGGYAPTLATLEDTLRSGSPPAERDGAKVGRGSCGISQHDSFPIVAELLAHCTSSAPRVLDIGCGSAAYLTYICSQRAAATGIGVEPSAGGVQAARDHIRDSGMSSRIRIVEESAYEFVSNLDEPVDIAIAGFVLHEMLGQDGIEGVSRVLRGLIARGVQHLMIIEVDDKHSDPDRMRDGLAKAYYNGYFLLHPLTGQRLAGESFWDQLFDDLGLVTVGKAKAPEMLDGTGFCIGWLLRPRDALDARSPNAAA